MSTAYEGKNVLDVMSKCAVNRNSALEKLITRLFHLDEAGKIRSLLEFGAGNGEFINRFARYPNVKTFAVEIDDEYVARLSQKHETYRSLDDLPGPVDFIYTIDVLEHIDDDTRVLRSMHARLVPDGQLLIYVPARPELYSKFDAAIGHRRRYTLKDLRRKVTDAGLSIRMVKYDDFLGYFAGWYNKLTSDGTLNPSAVRIYDRIFVPLTRAIESAIRPPIGKNILLLAAKR